MYPYDVINPANFIGLIVPPNQDGLKSDHAAYKW